MAILRRLNPKRGRPQNRRKRNPTAFPFSEDLTGGLFSLLFYSPRKNLDGLSKWLHQGKDQCFGCLPNVSLAFQQTESAIFFIAKSSPTNSLASSQRPGSWRREFQDGKANTGAHNSKRYLIISMAHMCMKPFYSNWNCFQRRQGRIIVLRGFCLGSHLKLPQTARQERWQVFTNNALLGSTQDKYMLTKLLCEANSVCLHFVLSWNVRKIDLWDLKGSGTHVTIAENVYFWSVWKQEIEWKKDEDNIG